MKKNTFFSHFRFLNFPLVFDLEPINHFLIYLAKSNILAKRAGRMLQGFDKSQFRIETIWGKILGQLALVVLVPENQLLKSVTVGGVGSGRFTNQVVYSLQSRLLYFRVTLYRVLQIELSPLRSDLYNSVVLKKFKYVPLESLKPNSTAQNTFSVE